METKASHVVVGAFILLLVGGLFVVTIWLAKLEIDRREDVYAIRFTGSVTGLQPGSPVRYRGIPIGTVSTIRIDPEDLTRVLVLVNVADGTPITSDSVAALEIAGLTGGAFVQIAGGDAHSPLLRDRPKDAEYFLGHPVIPSRPSTLSTVVDQAPRLLERAVEVVDRLLLVLDHRNRDSIAATLENLRSLSGELASAAGGIDTMMRQSAETLASVNQLSRDAAAATRAITPKVEGLLTNVDGTVTRVGGEVEGLARELRGTSAQLAAMVKENREPVRDFAATGLYEATSLITQLRELSAQIGRTLTRLENDPSGVLFGGTRRGVEAR